MLTPISLQPSRYSKPGHMPVEDPSKYDLADKDIEWVRGGANDDRIIRCMSAHKSKAMWRKWEEKKTPSCKDYKSATVSLPPLSDAPKTSSGPTEPHKWTVVKAPSCSLAEDDRSMRSDSGAFGHRAPDGEDVSSYEASGRLKLERGS